MALFIQQIRAETLIYIWLCFAYKFPLDFAIVGERVLSPFVLFPSILFAFVHSLWLLFICLSSFVLSHRLVFFCSFGNASAPTKKKEQQKKRKTVSKKARKSETKWRTIFTSHNVQINLFYANSTKISRDVTYGTYTAQYLCVHRWRCLRRSGRETCTNLQWNLFQFQWNWIRLRQRIPSKWRKWRDNGNCFGNFYRFNLKVSSQRDAGSLHDAGWLTDSQNGICNARRP